MPDAGADADRHRPAGRRAVVVDLDTVEDNAERGVLPAVRLTVEVGHGLDQGIKGIVVQIVAANGLPTLIVAGVVEGPGDEHGGAVVVDAATVDALRTGEECVVGRGDRISVRIAHVAGAPTRPGKHPAAGLTVNRLAHL